MAGTRFDVLLFAAGLGTRLRPLTDALPKALVPVAGVPMLERVARRVIDAGADRIVVNLHHHADRVQAFIRERAGFGVETLVSLEPERPLETGGGLKRAAALFRGDRPILLHNTDIVTDFPIAPMLAAHAASGALATVAVNGRVASRYLLFDDVGLCGHVDRDGATTRARPAAGRVRRRAFCGVHVVDRTLPGRLEEDGAFSIIPSYLRLAAAGERIAEHAIDGALWLDIGSPERLAEAEAVIRGSGVGGWGLGSVQREGG